MKREKEIQARRFKLWRIAGALVYKINTPSHVGFPDALVLWPQGVAEFVEFKAPGEKPTAAQLRMHEKLRAQGFKVSVIDQD